MFLFKYELLNPHLRINIKGLYRRINNHFMLKSMFDIQLNTKIIEIAIQFLSGTG